MPGYVSAMPPHPDAGPLLATLVAYMPILKVPGHY